jgi:ABC-type multidrug transport system permease subunit
MDLEPTTRVEVLSFFVHSVVLLTVLLGGVELSDLAQIEWLYWTLQSYFVFCVLSQRCKLQGYKP